MLTRHLQAAGWIALFYGFFAAVSYEFLAGPHSGTAALFGLDPAGSPVAAVAGMAAVLMVGTGCLLFAGSVPFLATWSGLSAASAALRRQPRAVRQDAGTLLACTALLAAWIALYGAAPLWLAWDALIVAGMAGSSWNLIARLPRRENHHV
jgi:hypothetical protein